MLDAGQQTRLLIYSAILYATDELFFDAIQQSLPKWRSATLYYESYHRRLFQVAAIS